ncbi:MAG: hypothetical protein ACE5KZ_16610 [Candidatus Scalinduaceae bacterium]
MLKLKTNQDSIPMCEVSERRKYQRVVKPIIRIFRIRPSYELFWETAKQFCKAKYAEGTELGN